VPDDEKPAPDEKPLPEEETSEAEAPEGDKFRPEAIAARIDKLGEETETDRIAREEEQKLLVRKKDRKKTGLEAAASKRLAKIGEGKVKRPSIAVDAIPEADPLLQRVARLNKWIRENQSVFAGVVGAVVIVLGSVVGWVYWQNQRNAQASMLLGQALADEHGSVSAAAEDTDDDTPKAQLYPTFKSADEKRDAALAKYRAVTSKYGGTGAAILARLGEGALLLDAGDAKAAAAAYTEVRDSALAKADAEVRGRALEGLGFVEELQARTDDQGRDAHLDRALTEFKALEAVDVDGFKELGMYHQSRVYVAKGDKAKAIEVLKDLEKRISDSSQGHTFAYLDVVVADRLRALDPTALPPKPSGLGGLGGPGGVDMSNPQVQKLIRQLQERGQQGGGGLPPGLPPMPAAPGTGAP
jgi:hypothetical protein